MEFTTEELKTLFYALSDRETRLFRDYEAYKANNNKEAMMDCLAELKKANMLHERIQNEEMKSAITGVTDELIQIVREKGEQDGNIYRIWLSGLNGVCNIFGHTDIMCAHLGEDGKLTFQVNSPNDSSSVFVYLEELPYSAALKVIVKIGLA